MLLSFVIPCYRSEKTVQSVIDEIIIKVGEREIDYEIIAVNDCSPDCVLWKLKSIAYNNPRVKVIDLANNMGKHAAVMAGYRHVRGDIVVNLDDDGQCPLDMLWDLVDRLGDDCDISMARYPKKKQSAFKNLGSTFNGLMAKVIIGKPRKLQISNFSVMKRFVVEEIVKYNNPYPYLGGLFVRTTKRIVNIPMEERDRTFGTTGFTLKKSVKLLLNGYTAFSVRPLRIASFVGIISAIIGFIFGLFTIIRKIVLPNISVGWSSTVAILLFIGGLIMLMLGMIGEYIGRIYISINNSPQYVIREKINIINDEAT